MSLLPTEFLFRLSLVCKYMPKIPKEKSDSLLALPESCQLQDLTTMTGQTPFADIRMAWNESGIAFQAEIQGKEELPIGDIDQPKGSDGVTLWIDTRDARTSHRASRYCHQFHLLPTGGGPDKDQAIVSQSKIHRALQDAPLHAASSIPFSCQRTKTGYLLEVFLPEKVLNGFDPEQHSRLGVYWVARDAELGTQTLQVGAEFPYGEDPSLWTVLQLIKE